MTVPLQDYIMNIDSLEEKACSDLMTEYREVTVPTQDYIMNIDSLIALCMNSPFDLLIVRKD